jgi:hypothetical protein
VKILFHVKMFWQIAKHSFSQKMLENMCNNNKKVH